MGSIPFGLILTKTFLKKDIRKKKTNKILFIGRFTNQKNLFNLLRIFSNNKYCLDLLGDGPLKDDLITYAKIIIFQ